MTALQDWINITPVNPNNLKSVILDAWLRLTSEEAEIAESPQLMVRGLERC